MVVNGYNYPDTCSISRSDGKTDALGKENHTIVYDGVCEIQYGGSGDTSYRGGNLQASPIIIIPVNNVLFKSNDKVLVISGINGRTQSFTIEQWEPIADDNIPELNDTEIWLKGGVDV